MLHLLATFCSIHTAEHDLECTWDILSLWHSCLICLLLYGRSRLRRRRDPWSCRLAGPHGATTVRPRPRRAYMELLSYGSRLLLVARRPHIQGRTPSATLLNCVSLIPTRVIHMSIGSANRTQSRLFTPLYVTFLSAGHRSCRWTFGHATSRTSVPPSQTKEVADKGRLHTTDDDIVLLVRNPTPPPTSSDKPNSVWGELLAC